MVRYPRHDVDEWLLDHRDPIAEAAVGATRKARAEQRLPEHVEDPQVLAAIAEIIHAAEDIAGQRPRRDRCR